MWKDITITGFADEISPDLDEQMRVLEKLGIRFIEMRGVDGKGLVEYSAAEAAGIRKRIQEKGFSLSSVGSPIGKIPITEPFGEHLEKFRHTAEIAHIMGTENIRMFSFFIPEGEDPALYRGEVMDRLGQMADIAAAENVVLLHENEKEIYGDTAPRCLEIMQNFYGDHFRSVFDFANFVQCQQDTLEAFEMLRPYTAYIHVKDALWGDGTVVPAGAGDGHVAEILKKLKDTGYSGFLSLEPHLADFTGFSGLENGRSMAGRKMTGEESFTLACESLMRILETTD